MDGMELNTGEANRSEKAQEGKPRRPLWKRVLKWTGLVISAFYLIGVLCNLWVIHTWNRDKTDYLAELNKIGWKDLPAEQNSWTYYARAGELFRQEPQDVSEIIRACSSDKCCSANQPTRFSELDDKQKELFKGWIADNEDAWQQAVLGSRQNYYWREIFSLDPVSLEPSINAMKSLRSVILLGQWRVSQKSFEGRTEKAVEDLLVLEKMGRHLTQENILLGNVTGFSCLTRSHALFFEILRDNRASLQLLERMQNELKTMFSAGFPKANLEAEILFTLGSIRIMMNKIGLTRTKGVFIPITFLSLGTWEDSKEGFQSLELLNTCHAEMLPSTRVEKRNGIRFNIPRTMIHLLKQSLSAIVTIRNKRNAEYEAVLTVVALARWKMEKGSYPETLKELVDGGVLGKAPSDPYAEGALRYERRGEDFILYSVGADFANNGGAENEENRWAEDGTTGDRVFWGGTNPEGSAGEKNGGN